MGALVAPPHPAKPRVAKIANVTLSTEENFRIMRSVRVTQRQERANEQEKMGGGVAAQAHALYGRPDGHSAWMLCQCVPSATLAPRGTRDGWWTVSPLARSYFGVIRVIEPPPLFAQQTLGSPHHSARRFCALALSGPRVRRRRRRFPDRMRGLTCSFGRRCWSRRRARAHRRRPDSRTWSRKSECRPLRNPWLQRCSPRPARALRPRGRAHLAC